MGAGWADETPSWIGLGADRDRKLLLMLDEAIRLEEQVRAGKLEPDVSSSASGSPELNFLFSLGSGLEEMERNTPFYSRSAL